MSKYALDEEHTNPQTSIQRAASECMAEAKTPLRGMRRQWPRGCSLDSNRAPRPFVDRFLFSIPTPVGPRLPKPHTPQNKRRYWINCSGINKILSGNHALSLGYTTQINHGLDKITCCVYTYPPSIKPLAPAPLLNTRVRYPPPAKKKQSLKYEREACLSCCSNQHQRVLPVAGRRSIDPAIEIDNCFPSIAPWVGVVFFRGLPTCSAPNSDRTPRRY